ncbi:HlyD family type I secretion periplasmic adaptor subunit [Bradyrhizobium rifense]|uniref:Membrane fusion protein (MFP) family protein n=1 Tax=Bradyrhizobium rifense TaxID=515499 RepID=A0A5D3KKD6_9BRAD|nr:HlyD family type I secretion periplasmic adaptor subunit [Bradyrhizobium rifense]TYL92045.1 HlyD family type I secretion periplasmic adaptor subunit [Bradyrhizobium rifense]
MKSTSRIIPFPTLPKSRSAEELEFLPAALEIVETPPSPLGRAIGATLLAMLVFGLSWASFSRVDIVATATGKVIPTGRSKVIQPFETGVVRTIRVSEGEFVSSGQIVIELDPTIADGEITHLQGDLKSAQLDTARLKAALADTDDPLGAFQPPESASADLVAMQRQFLIAQVSEHRAKIASLDGQKAQKEAALATITATINKLDAVIPTIEERVNIRKTLNEFGSRLQYFEVLQQLTESQQERLVQKTHATEMQAAIATILETRSQTRAEYRRTLLGDLAEAERKAAGFAADLSKAEQRAKFQSLTAPVSGTVQQLAVHTIGGVVTPAQALMVIVPLDSKLEVEAAVNNRDIGFVHAGDQVAIKVDTFDYTRYGLLQGKVLSISSDAVTRDVPGEKSIDRQAVGSTSTTSEPKGQEMTYVARISVLNPNLRIDDRVVSLAPGMAVTAEIKTGSRRLISYLLSPLAKYKQESMRER